MARPSKTKEWPERVCDIRIDARKCIVEYCTIDARGLPDLRRRAYSTFPCTVILGAWQGNNKYFNIGTDAHLWACKFNKIGHLSAVGTTINDKSIVGETLTVIINNDR